MLLHEYENKCRAIRKRSYKEFMVKIDKLINDWNKSHKDHMIFKNTSTKTGSFVFNMRGIEGPTFDKLSVPAPLYHNFVITFSVDVPYKVVKLLFNHFYDDVEAYWPKKNINHAIIIPLTGVNGVVNEYRKSTKHLNPITIKTCWWV